MHCCPTFLKLSVIHLTKFNHTTNLQSKVAILYMYILVLTMFNMTITGVDFVAMDEQVFREESVQRVYQYLRRMKAKQDLDGFKLQLSERPEGKENECLDCLLE